MMMIDMGQSNIFIGYSIGPANSSMNFTKGMLVVVNIVESWPVEAASILDCTMGKDSVSTHIRNRIFGWKSRFLSFGGRLIVPKFVLTSLSVYALSFFKAPLGTISYIESLLNNFFWGGSEDNSKIFWISWKNVCPGKDSGGFGVRQMREINTALLGKWCWSLLVNRCGLWYRVMVARYGEEAVRLVVGGLSSSLLWREVVKIRDGVHVDGGGWFEESIVRRVVFLLSNYVGIVVFHCFVEAHMYR
ncbi:transmembrane protein, putative [Medicago truncatula]|uniref:Transmembrane protein, putative n=1 Tax=Medicago truncatula TaxID=3880 RepID=G7KI60_MEDTR|nr:transmembrane protein, putative [Medicago truncatula]